MYWVPTLYKAIYLCDFQTLSYLILRISQGAQGLAFSFYKWEDWVSEWLSNPRSAQLVNDRTMIQSQVYLHFSYCAV